MVFAINLLFGTSLKWLISLIPLSYLGKYKPPIYLLSSADLGAILAEFAITLKKWP